MGSHPHLGLHFPNTNNDKHLSPSEQKSPDLPQYVLFLELGAVLIFGSYLHNKEKKSLEPDLGSNPPSATSTLRRPLP